MKEELIPLNNALQSLGEAIGRLSPDKTIAETQGLLWNAPYLDKWLLKLRVENIVDDLAERDGDLSPDAVNYLGNMVQRIKLAEQHNLPQMFNGGNGAQAAPALLATLDGIEWWVQKLLKKDVHLDPSLVPYKIARRAQRMQASLDSLAVDNTKLAEQLNLIKDAYEVVENLPDDIEKIKVASKYIDSIKTDASVSLRQMDQKRDDAIDLLERIQGLGTKTDAEAARILKQAGAAYSAATTKGLAEAFSKRALWLNVSLWAWVVLLMVTLAVAGYFGTERVKLLSDLLSRNQDPKWGVITLHFALSVVGVGAPLWFAWIATKQTNRLFRLAEDYGYKAAVAKAYQGYKLEAASIDPEFEKRLFSSALEMLGEPPIRLIDTHDHGSPWHEMATDSKMVDALAKVPGLAEALIAKFRGNKSADNAT